MARSFAFILISLAGAVSVDDRVAATANPVRKVVNLLQAMQKKVTAEGEQAQELYKKFMCYCASSGGELSSSISSAESKIPDLRASIKASSARKLQLEADVKSHQTERAASKKSIAEATAMRGKEKAAFDTALADNKANLAATSKAATAIENGMSGSFLQTQAASILKSMLMDKATSLNADKQELLAFLSGESKGEYAPSSGEILGILKTMADEMSADQKDMLSSESSAVKSYDALVAAKKTVIATLSKAVEDKLSRIGDLGVEVATMKGDLEDTTESLAQDTKFAADMKTNCAEKSGIHAKEEAARAEELVALAETIKILNDDDALELFKKTLPSAGASLLQLQTGRVSLRAEARALLSKTLAHLKPSQRHRLDFVLLALHGKKVGFDKIVKLIDSLVATLKKEQVDDDSKKEYCEVQFDQSDDTKKSLERSVANLETIIAETKDKIASLGEEIAAVTVGIAELDKSVSEATEQRKAEAVEHQNLMTSNTAARELLLFAKNRLNKFYNPKMYKPAPKRELSEGDQIYVNEGGDIPTAAPGGIANTGIGFMQLSSEVGRDVPPATAAAYAKKSGENNGVIAMIDLLVKDLDEEMQISQVEERNAQEEYQQMTADSAEKRREDSKSLTDKVAAKADFEASLERAVSQNKETARMLMGTAKYIASLHGECDWLMKYFDIRKTARVEEIDALTKAKAVLSGADYSFLQRNDGARARKFLRRA